jgi:hypothetical protein
MIMGLLAHDPPMPGKVEAQRPAISMLGIEKRDFNR